MTAGEHGRGNPGETPASPEAPARLSEAARQVGGGEPPESEAPEELNAPIESRSEPDVEDEEAKQDPPLPFG